MVKTRMQWSAEPWNDSEMLEVTQIVPETADTWTFSFRSPSGAWFDYEPGQFVTLDLPVPGGNVQRTYTMSSSPSRPLSISVTAKAGPKSVATRWMMENLKPGMLVKAYGPGGAEIASPNLGRNIISETVARGGGEYRGKVFAPDTGKTYNSKLMLSGNRLSVSGCVLGFCREGGVWQKLQ